MIHKQRASIKNTKIILTGTIGGKKRKGRPKTIRTGEVGKDI